MPCPHCYVGLCKKHKLQDHGEREKKLLASRQVRHYSLSSGYTYP
jgi:hypothetical protein